MNETIRFLIEAERLPAAYASVVAQYWLPLAAHIAKRRKPDGPLIVGVNGAQGSGKSTSCLFLEALLGDMGLSAVTLGIDDFYLTRTERQDLAQDVHPLFATRGVPGTHDTALLRNVLDSLSAGRSVNAPRFDKARDDRSAETRAIEAPVDVILFEGWCVGAIQQSEEQLREPANALEREEDPECHWRRTVNEHLATDYAGIFRRLDMLVMLAVGNFDVVAANRRLQERKLASRNPGGAAIMDEAALQRFIMHYERVTRWMLEEMPGRADVTFEIGSDQSPIALPDTLRN